ncbi:hypothetical protein MXD81_52875 [Microbacteriaceae bacterium K1510]|nr:hypothetical protein [Microbacteriaceae bacterium K1510]
MTYILAFLAAIAGAVGGFFAVVAISDLLASVLGLSSFEGEAGSPRRPRLRIRMALGNASTSSTT